MRRPGAFSFAALLIGVIVFLVACGTGEPAHTSSDASSDGAFPVQITHAHGATTISAKPKRIVALGWMTEDVVAALGVTPVGVQSNYAGKDGYSEWFRDHVTEELGGTLPEIIRTDGGGEYDLEQVLGLAPDLILAPHSGISEVLYKRMSKIAPTIPYAETPWLSAPWQEFTHQIGVAMGETKAADKLVEQTEKAMSQAASTHPNLQGTNFIYGATLWEGETDLGVYVADDPRVQFLHGFGLVNSPSLEEATRNAADFTGGVSLEKLGTLKTDVFVAWEGGAGRTKATLANPVVSRWAPIAAGNYYIMNDKAFAMATSAPTVLSIPWVLKKGFLDDLSNAIDGGAVVR